MQVHTKKAFSDNLKLSVEYILLKMVCKAMSDIYYITDHFLIFLRATIPLPSSEIITGLSLKKDKHSRV